MEAFYVFVERIWLSLTSSNSFELLIAFVAGGYLTTWMSERWQKNREMRSVLMSNVGQLVRVYQRYTRLLRQSQEKRSEQELDFLHADFLSEIRILQFDRRFKQEADEMWILGQRMANIRQGQTPSTDEKTKLNSVGRDFQLVLDRILGKI